MTEPSSGVPSEIADAEVDQSQQSGQAQSDQAQSDQAQSDQAQSDQAQSDAQGDAPEERVELHVDEEKMQAWDEVKSDYQVDPDNQEDRLPGSDEEGVDEGKSMEG
jgi:hypothetical protein